MALILHWPSRKTEYPEKTGGSSLRVRKVEGTEREVSSPIRIEHQSKHHIAR